MKNNKELYLATVAMYKEYNYESMKNSDYVYGEKVDMDLIWEYVLECREIGKDDFKFLYCDCEMHPLF